MAPWREGKPLKMKKHNRYFTKPGNKIFIANAGAVRFDYPGKWILEPGDNGAICLYERKPPTHRAILQASWWELLGPLVDWQTLPLKELFVHSTSDTTSDPRTVLSSGPLQEIIRPSMEAVWREQLLFDHEDDKEVIGRQCLARGGNAVTLLSYDFFVDAAAQFDPVWHDVLGSLVLGHHIKDPTTGF